MHIAVKITILVALVLISYFGARKLKKVYVQEKINMSSRTFLLMTVTIDLAFWAAALFIIII